MGFRVQGLSFRGSGGSTAAAVDPDPTGIDWRGVKSGVTEASLASTVHTQSAQGAGLPSSLDSCEGGLVFKADRLVYHSTPGWRVMKRRRFLVRGLEFGIWNLGLGVWDLVFGIQEGFAWGNRRKWRVSRPPVKRDIR